jgi:hypothetical protein
MITRTISGQSTGGATLKKDQPETATDGASALPPPKQLGTHFAVCRKYAAHESRRLKALFNELLDRQLIVFTANSIFRYADAISELQRTTPCILSWPRRGIGADAGHCS